MNLTGKHTQEFITARHKRFVMEYLKSGNATEAYKLAGFRTTSHHAAQVQASLLLKENKQVKAQIAAARRKVHRKLEITVERTLQELALIAYATPDWLKQFPAGKLSDKTAAVNQLCRVLGMNKDRVEHEGSVSFVLPLPGEPAPDGETWMKLYGAQSAATETPTP